MTKGRLTGWASQERRGITLTWPLIKSCYHCFTVANCRTHQPLSGLYLVNNAHLSLRPWRNSYKSGSSTRPQRHLPHRLLKLHVYIVTDLHDSSNSLKSTKSHQASFHCLTYSPQSRTVSLHCTGSHRLEATYTTVRKALSPAAG